MFSSSAGQSGKRQATSLKLDMLDNVGDL